MGYPAAMGGARGDDRLGPPCDKDDRGTRVTSGTRFQRRGGWALRPNAVSISGARRSLRAKRLLRLGPGDSGAREQAMGDAALWLVNGWGSG